MPGLLSVTAAMVASATTAVAAAHVHEIIGPRHPPPPATAGARPPSAPQRSGPRGRLRQGNRRDAHRGHRRRRCSGSSRASTGRTPSSSSSSTAGKFPVMVRDYVLPPGHARPRARRLHPGEARQARRRRGAAHRTGKAVGVAAGGILRTSTAPCPCAACPDASRSKLEADVTQLELGEHVSTQELKLPEGVTVRCRRSRRSSRSSRPRRRRSVEASPGAPARGAAAGARRARRLRRPGGGGPRRRGSGRRRPRRPRTRRRRSSQRRVRGSRHALVVGLGNPGREHAAQRHNVGFMAVDELRARRAGRSSARSSAGEWTRGRARRRAVVLLKPHDVHEPVGRERAAGDGVPEGRRRRHHRRPRRAGPALGDVRLKMGGGHAGHNGLRSIMQRLGTPTSGASGWASAGRPPGFRGRRSPTGSSRASTRSSGAELPDVVGKAVDAAAHRRRGLRRGDERGQRPPSSPKRPKELPRRRSSRRRPRSCYERPLPSLVGTTSARAHVPRGRALESSPGERSARPALGRAARRRRVRTREYETIYILSSDIDADTRREGPGPPGRGRRPRARQLDQGRGLGPPQARLRDRQAARRLHLLEVPRRRAASSPRSSATCASQDGVIKYRRCSSQRARSTWPPSLDPRRSSRQARAAAEPEPRRVARAQLGLIEPGAPRGSAGPRRRGVADDEADGSATQPPKRTRRPEPQ